MAEMAVDKVTYDMKGNRITITKKINEHFRFSRRCTTLLLISVRKLLRQVLTRQMTRRQSLECQLATAERRQSMEYTRHILVVSVEKEYSAAVQRHLRMEGFIVEVVPGTDKARYRIQQNDSQKAPFDLVIMHSVAQESDDLGFIAWLQKNQAGTSVILVSSYGHSDELVEHLRPSLDDYDIIPLRPQRMMELIDSVNRKRRCASVRLRKRIEALKSEMAESLEE